MNTKFLTKGRTLTIPRTLGNVLLATLVLTALVIFAPSRSEAGIRVSARLGSVRISVNPDPCCTVPNTALRKVVVRSSGRERIVVRNEYPRQSSCRGALVRQTHHRHGKTWVPGHYKTKFKRHGRLKKFWVPGHWIRI